MPANILATLFLFSALCEPHNMYKLCIIIVMCCAFCPWSSAAPKTWGEDPRSHSESKEGQNDKLQEEIDGQESILSKVRGIMPFLYFICFVDISSFRA